MRSARILRSIILSERKPTPSFISNSDFIQFQIPDRTVHVINVEDMDQYPDGFFIVDKSSAALSEAEEQLENLFSENVLVLGVKPEARSASAGKQFCWAASSQCQESCQSTSTRVSGDMLQTFGTKSGRLTRSDSLYLGKGAYEITWNLKTEDPAAAGSIECEIQVNEEKRQASSADGTDFADGTLAVTQIFYNTENLPVRLCVCLDETSSRGAGIRSPTGNWSPPIALRKAWKRSLRM